MRAPASRSPLLASALAASLVTSALLFLFLRLTLPGDNTLLLLESARINGELTVTPLSTEDGGLRSGDVVVAVEKRRLNSTLPLQEVRAKLAMNQPLEYTVRRDGQERTISVQLRSFNWLEALGRNWSQYLFLSYQMAISLFVFARRPRQPVAQLFMVASSITFGTGFIFFPGFQVSDLFNQAVVGLWIWGTVLLFGLLMGAGLHFSLSFPRTQPPLTHSRAWLVPVYVLVWIPYLLLVYVDWPAAQGQLGRFILLGRSTWALSVFGFPLLLLSALRTYSRHKGTVESRQIRWIVWGVAIATMPWLAFSVIPGIFGWRWPAADVVTGLLWCAVPSSFAISILRERLFDIDILINRTLVYAILTATLVLTYFGSVVALQSALRTLTGQGSQLAIVGSTLIIAGLFSPFRNRVQEFIDRRFYRRKYDAVRTLAAFAATVRDEVDLEALTAELQRVVDQTMQPERVWLWFRQPAAAFEPKGDRFARGERT